MSYTLGRTYRTKRGEARLVGVEDEDLIWQFRRVVERGDGTFAYAEGARFTTKRNGAEVRAPRRGAVEVRT